ncbi:MAG TPA: adenylyl-sulfate kinase [Candidatus Limnocylindria bacterium]|nr:adenylyl-sulfate kinase [Candidatus Limnocylindria bacterium]
MTDRPGRRSSGAVVFLTGLSGSGKSTIAEAFAERLRAAGRPVAIVDGDVLRALDAAPLGYDRASREANVRRAAELAEQWAADGQIAVAALIAPFESARREARAIVERTAPFLLAYVSTPLEVAEARDPKGLYRKARAGEIPEFTGIDSPYEIPADADLVLDTTVLSVDDSVDAIERALAVRLQGAPGS